jgi:crossover junction endodeoxyribonuclease RuvC
MRILGIDPGTRLTGYGCVETPTRGGTARAAGRGAAVGARGAVGRGGGEVLVEAGVIRLNGDKPLDQRLVELEADLVELVERLRPGVLAVEAVFSHVRFPAAAITMGHARGVILLVGRRAGLELVEIRPAEVKKSIAASGRAGKDQIQRAIQGEFGLAEPPSPPDVADALAIALSASRRGGFGG